MASKQVLEERAAALLALHQPGNPVVLPTVWDAWSAKLAVDAGFAALTVGSHPVADSIGKADNEGMTFDDLLARVVQITDAVEVPVSVDIESGYGEAPTRLIDGLLGVGAVGLNIEDTVHSEGGRLRSSTEHAELVGALRAAADAAGVHVVINARTDLFLRQDGDEADRVDRAIARLTEAANAGADVLYPGRAARPGYVAALDSRAAAAGQRDRAARSGRILRRSARWGWLGSASARSCRRHWPGGPKRSWPAGDSSGKEGTMSATLRAAVSLFALIGFFVFAHGAGRRTHCRRFLRGRFRQERRSLDHRGGRGRCSWRRRRAVDG